jgi:hypothetical protein
VPAVSAAPAANTAHATRHHRHFRAVSPGSAKRVINAHGAPTLITIGERLFDHDQDTPACSIGGDPEAFEPATHFDRLLDKILDGLVREQPGNAQDRG